MYSMHFFYSATWRAEAIPTELALENVSREFDAPTAEPCLQHLGSTLSVTWDEVVSVDSGQDVYALALAQARAAVEARMTRAGVPGRLLDVEAETEHEKLVSWRSD